jgi:hypothetical protein
MKPAWRGTREREHRDRHRPGEQRGGAAELCVLEALLDLGASAVEVLDLGGGLLVAGDVGDDEARRTSSRALAVEHHLQLLGRDRAPPAFRAAGLKLGG